MKLRYFRIPALLLATAMLFSSCVGSFGLFNKIASWNKSATSSKFLNEIIFILISPAYAVCGLVDVVVLNTIEFWSGSNPVAYKAGDTDMIKGSDGQIYALTYLKDGYRITSPDGQVSELIYNPDKKSWNQVKDGESRELFRFTGRNSIRMRVKGHITDFALNEQGLYKARILSGAGSCFAMR